MQQNHSSSDYKNYGNNNNFIKIDRHNSLKFVDEDDLRNIKISLFQTLASIEEEIVGKEINKLFDKLLPNNNDVFKISINLSKEYYQNNYVNSYLEFKLLEDVKNSLDSIINKKYNMEFFFFQSNLDELFKVLVYSYLDLSNSTYFFTSFNKKYKINTQSEFLREIEKILERNIDIIKRYRQEKENLNSSRSSFSSGSTYSYKYSSNSNNDLEIPKEMIILMNKFQTIKKIVLFVPNQIEDFIPYLLVLININWLFPNLFEVELDISNGPFTREIYEVFVENLNSSLKNKIVNVNLRKSFIEKETKLYLDTIKANKNTLILITVYSYFISKMEKLKIFNLIFPCSFGPEITECLKLYDVFMINFQFYNFFIPICDLFQLNVEFNSLDSKAFEKILSLFHKNNYLKSFKINLFTGEEHYSIQALLKLSSYLNINISQYYSNKTKSITNSLYDYNDYNDEFELFLLNKLLEFYEENLINFFFIFQTKLNLFDFHIKADLPRNIVSNDHYVCMFHKLIFNFFSILNNENSPLHTLKIELPNLSFDNRKYPGISKFFNIIKLRDKQINLYNLNLILNFVKVNNISNVCSKYMKFIQIGYFDVDTFVNFVNLFKTDEDFRKNSKLEGLQIYLTSTVFNPKKVIEAMKEFFINYCPKNLREFSLNTNLFLEKNDFIEIFNFLNKDRIERVNLEFNKKCMDDYLNVKNNNKLPELFFRMENRKLNSNIFFLLEGIYRNKSKSNQQFLRHSILNKKIFNKIQMFLEVYEQKSIKINFI